MAAGTHDRDDGDTPLAERQRRGSPRHAGADSADHRDAVAADDGRAYDTRDAMDEDELDSVTRLMGFLRSDEDE